jgi:hypothetical protein
MTNFGLSSEEAFDFIAAGYQKGLDGSGDFLESVNEYATQFSNGGADAGQFFSVLESGFQEGLLGTDKAADAFKEFRIRIQDGTTTTQAALDQLGLGEPFLNSLATGKITAVEAFDIVIQKLNETDDSSVVMQAGVGLLGVKFEDLGTKAALSLSTTQTKMSDIIGTMGDFDNDTFAVQMTSAWRTAVESLAGMDIWDGLKDQAGDAFEAIAGNLKTVFADYDFSDLESSVAEIWDKISGDFEDAGFDLTTVDGMKNAVDLIIESIESRRNRKGWWQVYGLGLIGQRQELVYPPWDILKEKPERFQEFIYGLDFGFQHPTALLKIWYFEDELFIEEVLYQPLLTAPKLIERMNEAKVSREVPIIADHARPEMIQELRNHGFYVLNADKSVEKGLKEVREWLPWR